MSEPVYQLELLHSLAEIPADQWQALVPDDYPFLRHDFLLGLERTGCTTAEAGWQPCHAVLRRDDTAVALLPTYLKSHSYGEYVFDWSWADAWRRSGLEYYPKLLSAIPFTPATGPRLCVALDMDRELARRMLFDGLRDFATDRSLSSWHVLFPEEAEAQAFSELGLCRRSSCQFHWFNRDYQDFDHFLADFASRKRKSLRRERRTVQDQGLTLRTLTGNSAEPAHWETFHEFYQMTYAKRSGHGGYLSKAFFTEVAAAMGDQVILVLADFEGAPVAGALYFRDADTLYGRYWGCRREFDMLHFEACYYRGIEYCIEHEISRFDPGAQGEHKIQRGFRPVITHSAHWVAEPGLREPVADFTRREALDTLRYQESAAELLPFRADLALD